VSNEQDMTLGNALEAETLSSSQTAAMVFTPSFLKAGAMVLLAT
jgi:hypothetical protein